MKRRHGERLRQRQTEFIRETQTAYMDKKGSYLSVKWSLRERKEVGEEGNGRKVLEEDGWKKKGRDN